MFEEPILLVGAGPMAIEYAKVLAALAVPFEVVGRGSVSARAFQEATAHPVYRGGLESWLKAKKPPKHAIVTVGENLLGKLTQDLLTAGADSILVEKPGAANSAEILALAEACTAKKTEVFVAYNRRFYASVEKAEEMIAEDGGLTSFNFEFTEWAHVIAPLSKAPGVKEEWFLHNSTHLIDLAFYLGGEPEAFNAYNKGGLEWHPSAAIYAGAGLSKKGALFSYQANWQAPGRWALECLTAKHRFIFRPLEKLQIQKIGSVAVEEVPLGDELDRNFKPGLYKQTEAFLKGDQKKLLRIQEQAEHLKYYTKMNGQIL